MIEIKKHYYNIGNKNINIMMFGDLHYSDRFNDKKLDLISSKMGDAQYLCIAGDLIDSTDFLYTNKDRKNRITSFIRDISKKCKIFITLGNHDIADRSHGNNVRDDNDEFWRELSKIDNVFVSRYNCYYEDDNVIIYMLEASYDYYYRDYKNEAKDILLNKIKEDKKLFDNMNNDKVKIVICHSPIYMTDSDILNEFKNFNFIFCGHMHNGMIPYLCDKIIRNNRGIVSPCGKLFSNNTRGTIDINNIHLIINGGITKLSKSSGIFSYFNFIYPISMDNIVINRKM